MSAGVPQRCFRQEPAPSQPRVAACLSRLLTGAARRVVYSSVRVGEEGGEPRVEDVAARRGRRLENVAAAEEWRACPGVQHVPPVKGLPGEILKASMPNACVIALYHAPVRHTLRRNAHRAQTLPTSGVSRPVFRRAANAAEMRTLAGRCVATGEVFSRQIRGWQNGLS